MMLQERNVTTSRQVRAKLSLLAGNLLQLLGIGVGAALLSASLVSDAAPLIVVELVSGWVVLYLSCHAIAHWSVGSALGIRFRYYTIGGTGYARGPAGVDWILQRIPFLGVQTEKSSMQRSGKGAKAAMWSAGALSSTFTPLVAMLLLRRAGGPYSTTMLFLTIGWSTATFIASFRRGGDFFKVRTLLARHEGTSRE